MKKIISLLIISVLLTSCMNNTPEATETDENNNTTKIETKEDATEINVVVEDTIEIIDNTENKIVIEEEETKVETNEKNTEVNTEATTDEAALEAEVNDLLDEFIDSLDSYDK